MHTFQATTILSYLLFSGLDQSEQIVVNLEKSVQIYEAMDSSSVARQLTVRIREALEAFKSRQAQDATTGLEHSTVDQFDNTAPLKPAGGELDSMDFLKDDVWSKLVGPEMLDIFSSNTDYLGWCTDAGSQNGNLWENILE